MRVKTDKVVFRIAEMWSVVVRLNHFQPVRSEPSVTPSCSGQGRGNEAGQGRGNEAGQGRGNEARLTSPCSRGQEARETILEERLG